MATAALCLLHVLALVITAVNTQKPATREVLLPHLLCVASMVFDIFCCVLLFGAAVAVVPDSMGSAMSFQDEMRKMSHLRLVGLESREERMEDMNVLDAYKRVERTTISACFFFVSYSNLCSLGYACYTHVHIAKK